MTTINLTKAYTEGIYADTPANRKLGRVGMSYEAYANLQKSKEITDEKIISENKIAFEKLKSTIFDTLINSKSYNNAVNIECNKGYQLKFFRSIDSNGDFDKCILKGNNNNKYFSSVQEDNLVNAVASYLIKNKIDLNKTKLPEEKLNSNTKEFSSFDIQNNQTIIDNAIQKAKDQNYGTIMLTGQNDNSEFKIYLARKKQSRWFKDFESFSIRDNNRNVIVSTTCSSEELFKTKLMENLQQHNINLKF